MDPRLESTAATLGLNTRLFLNCLDGLDDERGLVRTSDQTNHARFIAAHMVSSRAFFAGAMGGDATDPFESRMGAAKSIDDVESFPTVDEIRDRWPEVTDRLLERLGGMTSADLTEPTEYQFPVDDRSALGIATFLTQHDTYHLGQLSLLRKHLGLGAMAYR